MSSASVLSASWGCRARLIGKATYLLTYQAAGHVTKRRLRVSVRHAGPRSQGGHNDSSCLRPLRALRGGKPEQHSRVNLVAAAALDSQLGKGPETAMHAATGGSQRYVIRFRRLVRSKLRIAKKTQVFLELFAGAGKIGKRITHVTGDPVIYFGILHGGLFDLTDGLVLQLVCG